MQVRRFAPALFSAALLLGSVPAFAQVNIVVPQTAGQNQVRWDKFDWQYVDLLSGDKAANGAGLRLYYYKSEDEAAQRAAAVITEEYEWLAEQFDYKPQVQIPYILYNSHGELEQTNVFAVPESTLGVTSPEDLRMTTAYWGDHERFRHVSLHEMTHQFMIQKVNGIAERAKAYGSPLQKFPLWFTEGIAEYYSTPGGIDAEAEDYIRDLVANPDPTRGYILPPFLSDDQRSFIYTYKLGQVRCYFLAETYGKGKLQELLGASYRMRGWRRTVGSEAPDPGTSAHRDRVLEFDELLERATGDSMQKIELKWEDWLKRRYFKQYLDSNQKYSDYREVEAAKQYPDSFVVSPDGNTIVYRGIEPVTGETRLYLIDPRDPISGTVIAADSHPGDDTLHFFDRPVAAIDAKRIAYVSRDGANDVLRILDYRHSSHDSAELSRVRTHARFRVSGVRHRYDPRGEKIREMGSPAFSPDGKEIAFIGLDFVGVTDVWVLNLETGKYRRLTHDDYAEKELDWGPAGIVYCADATETRQYNLFLIDPSGNTPAKRLTWGAGEHRYPRFTPDGKTVGYSSDLSGKWDLYSLSLPLSGIDVPNTPANTTPASPNTSSAGTTAQLDGALLADADAGDVPSSEVTSSSGAATSTTTTAPAEQTSRLVRSSDFPTGLTYPAFTANRAYALGMKSGKYRLFSIERTSMEAEPVDDGGPRSFTAWSIPTESLEKPKDYSIWQTSSWNLEEAFATLGGSTGVYGSGFLLFDDKMRDRTVYVVANAYGRVDLLDAQAVYVDRTRRISWGTAAFITPQPVIDPEFSQAPSPANPNGRTILFIERKYGAAGLLEYPLNRYLRVGAQVGLAGSDRFIPDFYDAPDFGYGFGNDVTGEAAWKKLNGGIAPEVDSSVSLGFDTLALDYQAGEPLQGSSVVASVSSYYQPTRASWFGETQVDAQHFIRLYKTVNLGLRGAWGESFGDEWKRPFYISSVDNLRGVPWYSFYLVSEKYLIANAELHFPLNGLVRLLIFQNIEGVLAMDAGSLFNKYSEFDQNKTAAYVAGFNFNLAIFQFRLHFAKSFDVGGLVPGQPRASDGQVIVPTGWVTNFTIRYLFY